MTTKLVKIDTKKNIYSYYEGKQKVHAFVSDQPLTKDYVEQFRTDARSMIQQHNNVCVAERQGDGLQTRTMEVQILSHTPVLEQLQHHKIHS